MPRKKTTLPYSAGPIDELSAADRELVAAARAACDNAYAPYSDYRVGAAARLVDGRIATGANQESEVFPNGLCAERVLLLSLKAREPEAVVDAVAIAAQRGETSGETVVTPCGSCAQTLLEIQRRQGKPVRIIMTGRERYTAVDDAGSLLPFAFTLDV